MIYFTTRLSTRGTSATRDGIGLDYDGLITISCARPASRTRAAMACCGRFRDGVAPRRDAKRFVVIVTCMTAMVLMVNQHGLQQCINQIVAARLSHCRSWPPRDPDSLIDLRTAREFGRDSIQLFVTIMIAIGFLDTLADPEEGRRVLASCGVKVTRLRSTLTALLVWFVLVSLVRALALTVFEVVTDFNAERGNVENGKV